MLYELYTMHVLFELSLDGEDAQHLGIFEKVLGSMPARLAFNAL
jgi:hypothetical protein